jgi:hypothetical protein
MTLAGSVPMIQPDMDGRGVLHLIENDLSETWIEDWAGVGVAAIEDYLEKHLAFLDFLEDAATSN